MKILLVDDHILFAKSLSIALCDNPEIENNLKLVDDTIREFYGWKTKEDKQND